MKNLGRGIQIYRTFAKYRCYFFLKGTPYYRSAKFAGFILAPRANKNSYVLNDGEKLANIFQELGPVFIKFGQTLSIRPDVVGDEIAASLTKLQDRLPPFPTRDAIDIIEKEFDRPIKSIFNWFDENPAAAASIAQVHFARDLEDNEVAVKILRPGIEERFARDIDFMFEVADFVERKMPKYKRLRLYSVVETLAEITAIEMDLQFEGAAANELAQNFKNDPDLRVPKVYWQNTSQRVLTIEKFTGTRIDDVEKLLEEGHDVNDLLRKSADIFLKQALRDGFFHADMHPGNVLVDADGNICVFDFGIMGRIDRKTRIFLAELLLGFLNRDYKKVADVHFEIGILKEGQSRDLFAQACRSIGEPIFDLPQSEISIARLLQKLFKITEQFNMETQPQLLLLQKTMMMAEGIGRRLNPNINFWILSRDLIEDWGKENLGPKARIEEAFSLGLKTLENFGEAIRNLNKTITSNGLVVHPEVILANRPPKDEDSFWKGFLTAIILTILVYLIGTKLKGF